MFCFCPQNSKTSNTVSVPIWRRETQKRLHLHTRSDAKHKIKAMSAIEWVLQYILGCLFAENINASHSTHANQPWIKATHWPTEDSKPSPKVRTCFPLHSLCNRKHLQTLWLESSLGPLFFILFCRNFRKIVRSTQISDTGKTQGWTKSDI